MAIHIFTVPFDPKKQVFHDEELRGFLLNKRVTAIRPEFFQSAGQAFWSVFVEYDPLTTLDTRGCEGLNEPQQLLWQRLQEWRKETAQKDGIPVYIIATNRQLSDVVRLAPRTLEALRQIQGFGKKKLERYGMHVLQIVSAFYDQPPHQKPEKPHE